MTEEFNTRVRALGPHEWWKFREIRLEALKTSPGNYGATHDEEAALHDQVWIARIVDPKGKIFGLFHEGQLIGINGVFTYNQDLEGKTAFMAMWYMRENYRGRGLFAPLAQTGVDWAEKQERFNQIIVRHRAGNDASRVNIEKAGFAMTEREPWTWPDGVTADLCTYERKFER